MPRYSKAVRDYFSRPVPLPGKEISAQAGSRARGAWLQFGLELEDRKLRNVGFRAFACPHIIAACQRAAEVLEGQPATALSADAVDQLQQELRQKFDIPVDKTGKLLILKDALLACEAQIVAKGA